MLTTAASTNAIVIADIQGCIQYWSDGAEQLFGYPARDAEGQSLDLIVPDEYRTRHWQGFHRAMNTRESRLNGAATNIPVRCQDGTMRLFSSPARPY